ncbi:hypothetical protein Tco_0819291 [Tanacetum coccineum]|uniref:Uncharacterized protein n=1 Tax=Tanacetum coccineum TaxID=301880 RepID=A0ABQ5A988_9ASTR
MQRGKVENATTEMMCGLNQIMQRKECGGADNTYYDLRDMYGGHVWRRILIPILPRSSSGYDTNWIIVDRLTTGAYGCILAGCYNIAASEAAMEAIWICKFISRLKFIPSNDRHVDMYCDNTDAITIADESFVDYLLLRGEYFLRPRIRWLTLQVPFRELSS